jgi:hypothetical protein
MKKRLIDFDFAHDFREVHDLLIKEKLSEEDIEEGLEPEEVFLKVCLSSHAYKRIYNDFGRQCDWESVEDLILEKGHMLFSLKTDEEFAIKNSDDTLVLICKLYPNKGDLVLVLETVIRQVIILNGKEVEKKVKVTRNTKTV